VFEGKAADLKEKGVLEPHGVKMQVIKSASEAAGMILKIDDVIASSRSKDSPGPPKHDGEGGEEGASEY
jgi:chaperonin GroEL (HSP60 family)